MLVGGDIGVALGVYRRMIALLEKTGNDIQELRSDFSRIFRNIEKDYLWADNRRFSRWMKLVLAGFWLSQRAIIGREAAMRLIGTRALSGRAPVGTESAYDFLSPIYDSTLELLQPTERPSELAAMDWDFFGERGKGWLNGEAAANWTDYPEALGEFHIVGERTLFIRPDWEWPREERYRGLLDGLTKDELNRESLASRHELTYETYLRGIGQADNQLIVWNSERQLVGPAYRWIAINSAFARSLGWQPSGSQPFEWRDTYGELMVKSLYWKDGWIGIEPPRFEALGEGWLVLATTSGLQAIRDSRVNAEYHLWVERLSRGSKQYSGSWHLSSPLAG